jgi:hypothetical protein
MKFTNMVVASLAIGLSSAALAQSIGKPEDQIRWRQSHDGLEHGPYQGQYRRYL